MQQPSWFCLPMFLLHTKLPHWVANASWIAEAGTLFLWSSFERGMFQSITIYWSPSWSGIWLPFCSWFLAILDFLWTQETCCKRDSVQFHATRQNPRFKFSTGNEYQKALAWSFGTCFICQSHCLFNHYSNRNANGCTLFNTLAPILRLISFSLPTFPSFPSKNLGSLWHFGSDFGWHPPTLDVLTWEVTTLVAENQFLPGNTEGNPAKRGPVFFIFRKFSNYATYERTCCSLYHTQATVALESGSRELHSITSTTTTVSLTSNLHPFFAALTPNRSAELLCHRPSYQSD